jgi:hypothetical protein
MSQSGDVLDRFIEALVQQITITRPEYLTIPFTVAEIYQDLVPYRSHRDSIGVEMSGDYEDALARMLSGEGDYLLLDSDVARRELQAELATRNPNTALFREFAAVDVRLHPSRVPSGAGPGAVARGETEDLFEELEPKAAQMEAPVDMPQPPSDQPADEPGSEPANADEDGVVGHIETVTVPPLVSLSERPREGADPSDTRSGDATMVCHWCREELPGRDSIRFCPFCGGDLRPSPCRECGEAVEARWQFCASCGADVRA